MPSTASPVPDFWWKWLLIASCAVVVSGAGLVLLSGSVLRPVLAFYYDGFDPVVGFDALSNDARAYHAWVYGVVGGVMMGWGVLMGFIVYFPFRRGEPWAWNALAGALIVWYVFDTGTSAVHGVGANVLLNTVILLAIGIPLVATRRMGIDNGAKEARPHEP